MKVYTFIIGTAEDFESIDELMDHYESSSYLNSICDCSAFEFEAPTECDQDTVTLIGRGYAFSNGWCMDNTFSFLVEGSIETSDSQTETQLHDLWEL